MILRRTLVACCLLTTPFGLPAQEQAPDAEQTRQQATAPESAEGEISLREVQLGLLRSQIAALRGSGRDAPAIAKLGQLVSLLGTEYGNDSSQLIEPLLDMADLQLSTGEKGAAATSFERAIEIMEQSDSVFSIELVEPLAQLAGIYNTLGRSEEAVERLRRARHITHRQLGILNTEQLDIADELAESYFLLGQIGEANRENRFAFRVNEREFGSDSPELVPALNKLGAWYERIGQFSVARRSYRRAIEILENHYGPDDLRLTDPLRRIAKSYMTQGEPLREGEKSLTRALEIYEANPGADVYEHANSLIEFGDWLMVLRRRDPAMRLYSRAWDLLSEDGKVPERAASVLGRPKRLRFRPPLTDEGMMRGAPTVFVDVSFSVTPEGTVRDVEVIGGDAHWQIKREFREAINKAKFRPRFEDGEPVRTDEVLFRYTYHTTAGAQKHESVGSVDGVSDQKLP